MGRKGQGKNVESRRHNEYSKQGAVAIGELVDKLLREVAQVQGQTQAQDTWETYCKVQDILQQISSLEATQKKQAHQESRSEEDITQFMDWLKDCAVDCKGIKIDEFPGLGLGITARKDYKLGDLVMRVPRRVMITEERAKMSPLGALVDKDPILKQMPHVMLALFLLFQKYTPDSYWRHYIKVLPPSYSTILYFTSEDFQYLKGSPVFSPALMLYLTIVRQYGYFHKLIHMSHHQVSQVLKERFTFDEYRWAVSTVMTRQNKVPGVGDGDLDSPVEPPLITALIPLWDMCNHIQGEITTGFNRDSDEAECFALKDFKKDEQILIFYGNRNNAYFFLYNGFVFEDNHHDSMSIMLGVSGNDPLCEDRRRVLGRIKAGGGRYTLHGTPQPCISGELLAIARVLSMKKEQLTVCLESSAPENLLEEAPITGLEEVDRAAYTYINTRCKLLLLQYTRNVEGAVQDIKELTIEEKESHKHRYMIDLLKKTEMRILQRAVEWTQDKVNQFEQLSK